MTTAQAARLYAESGLPVFPIHPIKGDRCACGDPTCNVPGKHPVTKGWQKTLATGRSTDSIWRTDRPTRGIGLACGERSGCFVLDIDVRHGGDETLAELVARHGPLPETWTTRTGGGGSHLFFAWPDLPIRNSASKVGPGLDVRGDGGYVVLPPSPHVSGSEYEWTRSFTDTPLAAAPTWLIERAAYKGSTWRKNGKKVEGEVMVPGGSRHAALVSLLGAMRRWGACPEVLDAAAVAFAQHQCLPDPARPLDLDHVHATALDIARRYSPGA